MRWEGFFNKIFHGIFQWIHKINRDAYGFLIFGIVMDEVGNISVALHLSPWLPFDGLLSFSLFTSFSQLDLTP